MTPPILGIWASQISGHLWQPAGAYDALATVTVPSGGVASIDFTGIPTGYKHLQLRCIVQTNRATYGRDSVYMKVNAGTAGNFSWHFVMGEDGSSVSAQNGVNANYVNLPISGTSTGGSFGAGVIDILDYSDTAKYKTVRALGGIDHNGLIAGYGGVIGLMSGSYRDTGAITSINFTAPNNFTQYTQFALYGVK
jgi:hypothetical protein